MKPRLLVALTAAACLASLAHAKRPDLGLFGAVADVGVVSRPSTAVFDKTTGAYTLGASGENIWGAKDAFGYLATKMKGEVRMAANVALLGESAQANRKAGLMLRASLTADSAYADVALHGSGLISLQYRLRTGGPTNEIQCGRGVAARVMLERRGRHVLVGLPGRDGKLTLAGCVIAIDLGAEFLAGLFVCAHDPAGFETAKFTQLELAPIPKPGKKEIQDRFSAIEILPLDTLHRRLVWSSKEFIQNVRFTRDGAGICYLGNNQLQRLALEPGTSPALLEANAPECIPPRQALTQGERWNYFHSKRGREVQIWRSRTDGSNETQLTKDEYFNWYPQLSPDGENLVFLSSRRPPWGPNMPEGDYLLRLMPAAGGEPREIARVFANASSLAMPAWSPDGKSVVFIGYEPLWEYAKR